MSPIYERERARRRDDARGFRARRWCGLVMLVLGLAAGSFPVEASDRVLIPGVSELWRTRLKEALRNIRDGRVAAGLEILGEAVTDRGGTLFEVRNEDLLVAPLEVEIEDEVLVTEKSEVPPGVFPRVQVVPRGLGTRYRFAVDDSIGNQPRRFLPVSTVSQIILGKLPAPVLQQYRALHDERARGLLEDYQSSGDLQFLERLVHDDFFSSYGAPAAELLADTYWEAGHGLAAIGLWRTVLASLSSGAVAESVASRKRLSAKLARGLRGLGRDREAGQLEATLREVHGDARGVGERKNPDGEGAGRPPREPSSTVGMTSPASAASPESLVSSARPVARQDRRGRGFPSPWTPARWGGELTMDALPEIADRSLEFSWDSWIWMPEPVNLVGFPFTLLVDGDSLFVSGPRHVHRLDARPRRGSLLQRYTKPGLDLRYPEDNETLHYSLTLWKKRFEPYALLSDLPDEIIVTSFIADLVDFDHYLGYEINAEVPIRGLIAFDSETSQPLWKTSEHAVRETAEVLARRAGGIGRRAPRGRITKESGRSAGEKGLSYNSTALVKQGLVVVGGWIQRGYINNVLRALDLRDGSLVWETFVSSAQLEQTMFGELAREPFPGAVCEEGGIVYYCTQEGAVAAVELETGKLCWLMTYETIPIETTFGRQARKRLISWGANPMLVKDNILLVTPRDSQYLYAIDTGSGPGGMAAAGRILWKYHNRPGELRDFIGYLDGYLYFSGHGSGAVLRLDIRHLDAWGRLRASGDGGGDSRGLRSSPVLERAPLRLGIGSSIPPGALTPRGIVIADGGRLKLVSPDLQEITDLSPPFRELPGRTVPGRVQVAGGTVFITSKNLISAYTPVEVDR